MRARKEYAFGPLKDIFLHQNCIGFVRAGTTNKPGCVVVLSNASEDTYVEVLLAIACVADRTARPREHCSIPAEVAQVSL